ncbi:MAG: ISL3 family transposase [Pseudomonadota bacterium]|nr:ISL3 family transposase [Pseudomonadota bacterium]
MVVFLVPSSLLSALPHTLEVSCVLPTVDHVIIEAGLPRSAVECPSCGLPSRRLHSRYPRVLQDLPWQGRPATIRIAARRFRCLNPTCLRKTFAERLGSVALASARRTTRLGDLQRHVAFALGGEAAARLSERLAIPVSPDTLLRMAARPMEAETAFPTPKVLGVDDWAWRRGHRYGTILVDLERNEVVDLLPDRQAETLAGWLRQHPGIEVVARDRAGAYADGIRRGAPEAIQVSDRWHLLRSLGDAVRAVIDRHHGAIQRAAKQINDQPPELPADDAPAIPPTIRVTTAQRRSQDAHARRHSRYQEAVRLRTAGVSISSIAVSLGAERKTIRGWLRVGKAPLWSKPPRESTLTPHADYLEGRWAEGCRNAALLWREVVTRGFSGRPGVVRRWAETRRKGPRKPDDVSGKVPSGRQVARLLMANPDLLPEAERSFVAHLLDQVPPVADAITVAKRLNALLRRKTAESLTHILDAAIATPLKEFAASLQRDIGAIQAALDLPWTTSPVEGQISRLKMLKRTMYGRAGFQLLRARVLHAA